MSAKTGRYIKCKICGKEKYYSGYKFKREGPPMYCSRKCKYIGAIKQSVRKCLICNIEFQFKPGKKRKHCSLKCAGIAKQQRIELICHQCGKVYKAVLSSLPRKYCSPECRCIGIKGKPSWNKGKRMSPEAILKNSLANRGKNHYNWGKHLSKETKEKISQSQKGKIIPEETKRKIGQANKGKMRTEEYKIKCSESMRGENNHFYGKKFSEEHRKKLSESHIGIQAREKHPNWNGGSSFEPYGIEFNDELKNKIRLRDAYVCQKCYRRENSDTNFLSCKTLWNEKLHIHHINYDKKDNRPENLISLCRACHTKTNFNRDYWQSYFIDFQIQHFKEESLCL